MEVIYTHDQRIYIFIDGWMEDDGGMDGWMTSDKCDKNVLKKLMNSNEQ